MEGSERTKLGRRALLAAGAAGVAAAAVQAVAPAGVRAADGWAMNIGETNLGNKMTWLKTAGGHGFQSESDVGDGLRGFSSAAPSSGVFGRNSHADGFAVYGRNTAQGTFGHLGGKGSGVYGFSPLANVAVKGESSSPGGAAVLGINTATGAQGGLGLRSSGVWGGAPTDLNHWGLEIAEGRVSFSRSGLLTIAAGKSSVSTTRPALNPATMVLATLQSNRAGVYIQAAVASPAAGKITIYLNKKVTAATKVAYFVLD